VGTHSLRKTFGRAIYEQTGSLTQLRELLGHRDESDTSRYIGLQQDDFDAAIGKLRFIK
jgi:integrase